LTACGAGATQQPPGVLETTQIEQPPTALEVSQSFFIPGEVMRFELSLRGVVGGETTVAVGQPGEVDGHRAIILRSRVASAGVVALIREVRDEVVTWIDTETGLPIRQHADVKFGKKESIIDTEFNGGEPGPFAIDYERKGHPKRTFVQSMPRDESAYDIHSIIGVVRAWDAEPGTHAYFYVLAGRRLWQNTIRLTERETIRTSLGRFPAIRIDGVAKRMTRQLRENTHKKPREFTVWISDDADRVPLRVVAKTEYGDVKAELIDYDRPERRVSTR
jgi:hypothetical protein